MTTNHYLITMRHHVLLINQYFPPDTAATAKMAALVAEALAQRFSVTVLAGRPSYDPTERHPAYLWRRERHGNLVVERVGSTAFPRQRMKGRLSNYLSYLALTGPRALAIPTDVVLCMTDPPVLGIVGAVVARLKRRPFVYNIRDLYPDMAVAGGLVRPAWWLRVWERLHRWALRQADRVIVLGEDMRERVIMKGVAPERVIVVRDGASLPAMTVSSEHPVAREIRCGYPFVLLHAGNIGFYGAWETLVEAARLLDGEDVGMVFVGDGAAKHRVEALVDGCPSVRFLPFRPSEEVPYVLAAGDLHVVTIRRRLEGVVVPSKLYHILAAGRPVLAVAPEGSDVARIVRRFGCGLVADPDSPESVAQAVCEAMTSHDSLVAMGEQARAAAQEFDQSRELERFVSVVEKVLSDEPRA